MVNISNITNITNKKIHKNKVIIFVIIPHLLFYFVPYILK